MIRCSSCKQSRWIYPRFRKVLNDLEWLTGWTPYGCLACGRRGWHRWRRTPPALDDLRQAFPGFSRKERGRFAGGTLRRSLWITAGGLVATFAFGLYMGAPLFSGSTGGAGRESPAPANDPASKLIAQVVPVEATAESSPAPETRPAVTPPVGDMRPAVTPPVAETPVGSALRLPKPVVREAAAQKPVVREAAAQKPVVRAAAVREPGAGQRTPATVQPVRREADDAPRVVQFPATATRSTSPELSRYRGSLAIRSEPLGAVVSVDGHVVGSTPILLKAVPAGSRVVRIESQGYERWSSAARVAANQETLIVATLQRESPINRAPAQSGGGAKR